jgi:hypothetical protein
MVPELTLKKNYDQDDGLVYKVSTLVCTPWQTILLLRLLGKQSDFDIYFVSPYILIDFQNNLGSLSKKQVPKIPRTFLN